MTDAASTAITAPDLLTTAIDIARKRMEAEAPPATKKRIHILWAAARQARDVEANKLVHDAFMALAIDVNLIDKNGRWTGADVRDSIRRYGAEDVSRAINWALRG